MEKKQIAILDFGSQYSHLIARRLRELNIFCELYSCLCDVKDLDTNNIIGIVLSGGPSSVYDADAPHVKPSVWSFISEKSIPVLGICYGMQEIAHVFGGVVEPSSEREFGRAFVEVTTENEKEAMSLFEGVSHSEMWMSHGGRFR